MWRHSAVQKKDIKTRGTGGFQEALNCGEACKFPILIKALSKAGQYCQFDRIIINKCSIAHKSGNLSSRECPKMNLLEQVVKI